MDPSAGQWLSALILDNIDDLAADMGAAARRHFAVYRTMSPELVNPLFVAFYQVLARVCASGDFAAMRVYVEHITSARLRDGATIAGYIEIGTQAQQVVRALVARKAAADPALLAAVLEILDTIEAGRQRMFTELVRPTTANPPASPQPGE